MRSSWGQRCGSLQYLVKNTDIEEQGVYVGEPTNQEHGTLTVREV